MRMDHPRRKGPDRPRSTALVWVGGPLMAWLHAWVTPVATRGGYGGATVAHGPLAVLLDAQPTL